MPCKPLCWIDCPEAGTAPMVAAYRLNFQVEAGAAVTVDVTADERYELFLDGRRIGRGSERGDNEHWFFETYELALSPGSHVLVARVWSLGDFAPAAQLSVQPGFFLRTQDPSAISLGTGQAPWEAKRLRGYTFSTPAFAGEASVDLDLDGFTFPWGFENGEGEGWLPARVLQSDDLMSYGMPSKRRLCPATLPAMRESPRFAGKVRQIEGITSLDTQAIPVLAAQNLSDGEASWQRYLGGEGDLTIPPRTSIRVVIDIADYCCAYPEMTVSQGRDSVIRLQWAECLFVDSKRSNKGHRDEIEGRFFVGVGDVFRPDGGMRRRFENLWWRAGRYLELVVITADAPLILESLVLRETGYPLQMETSFLASDSRLESVIPMAFRSMQMCMHETYIDCPYYEQMMYVGDTRLECLTTYTLTSDARLPRKAIALFNDSRISSGLTQSRYPSRRTQVIPPFSLWWVGMVSDYLLWKNDPNFVSQCMPGVRAILDFFLQRIDSQQLVGSLQPWGFVDWVPGWDRGVPPNGEAGYSGILNWHLVYTLRLGADLERSAGEPLLAKRLALAADRLAAATTAVFWDENRGLFADDPEKAQFSEHCQCLALLAGGVKGARRRQLAKGFFEDSDLARTTIYFSHYLFEAYRVLGRIDLIIDRMSLWFDAPAFGFKTTPESPEPSRSDCHAWGAHPIYHYFATILGIRPGGPGFKRVKIAPQLGSLKWARGSLCHPLGTIEVEVRREGRKLSGSVKLPKGLDTVEFGGWAPEVLYWEK